MSDISYVIFGIILTIFYFFIGRRFFQKYLLQFTCFVIGLLVLWATKVIFNLEFIFFISGLASLCIGLISSYLNPLMLFNLVSIFFIGAFCLSSHSNQLSMFVSSLIMMLSGFLLGNYFSKMKFNKILILSSLSIVIYYFVLLIILPRLWLNGILMGILSLVVGLLISKFRLNKIYFAISILVQFWFAYSIYPDFSIQVSKKHLLAHDLWGFHFLAKDSSTLFELRNTDLVLVETWDQYCTNCFRCMDALHPVLKEFESKFDFKHYYLFTGSNFTYDSVYTFERIPYKDQVVLVDSGMDYYKTIEMQGAPYLNFYKNGIYIFSIAGYDPRYEKRYKRFLGKELLSLHKNQ